ncbi:MAG: META domain-containing protein [Natronohydrobacter sp.]|nr:META domain-containing protein [Natronohydrobacter sp.]
MRLAPLAATVLSLSALLAPTQAASISLGWESPATEGTEAVLTFRTATGATNLSLRYTLSEGAREHEFVLPHLPRGTQTLQGGLAQDGRVIAQGAVQPLDGDTGRISEHRLHPALALGFADIWQCAENGALRVTHDAEALHLKIDGAVVRVEPQPDQDQIYSNAAGYSFTRDGNRARLVWQDGPEDLCEIALFAPILPMLARAHSGEWRIELGRERALIEVPGLEDTSLSTTGLVISAPRDGTVSVQGGGLVLRLLDDHCRLGMADLIYPVTARLRIDTISAPPEGCAGDPLSLLAGEPWRVTSLLGIPMALAPGAEMTLELNDNRLSGRATCNRYVAQARIEDDRLDFHDLGTTRLPCAMDRGALEQRFLDALEAATGFDISTNGMLTLRAGPMPVLTAILKIAP